jgi:hypothetical protein
MHVSSFMGVTSEAGSVIPSPESLEVHLPIGVDVEN